MNGTDYTSVELALSMIAEFGHELYFELFPNPELELMIADMERV